MKELISDLLRSKKAYDSVCCENRNPIETMEQYLYTYFT